MPGHERNLVGRGGFANSGVRRRPPKAEVGVELDSALMMESERLPRAHRGEPQFIGIASQFSEYLPAQSLGIADQPKPDMGVEKKLQSRRTSHSSSSFAGETISPINWMEPFKGSIKAERSMATARGITSATGLPWRVMRIGCLVLLTC